MDDRPFPPYPTGPPDRVPFPDELYYYGLNEKLLAKVFHYVQAQKKGSLPWSVRGVPSMLFYQQLHRYMKKWPLSSSSTKTAIGKFYISIDKNLQDKGYRPDNAYRFIERTVGSKQPPSATMKYGVDASGHLFTHTHSLIRLCTH